MRPMLYIVPLFIWAFSVLQPYEAYAQYMDSKWRWRGTAVFAYPDTTTELSVNGTPLLEREFNADNQFGFEVDVTYFVTDYFGVELSGSMLTGFRTQTLDKDGKVTEDEDDSKLFFLPIGLNAQYHFAPYGEVTPYVGAGLNYTFGREGGFYTHDFGYNVQAGADWWLSRDMALSLEVKQFYDMQANLKPIQASGFLLEQEVTFDPLFVGVGVATRF